ncbi:response regulator transcription factor [Chitinophaga oryzae]|uniref:Response regulator transcription factor n=1 Tax=Chitinophaga oryzae TaxID=2725414 RepID=A0AAE6ZG76_9BACT|nr:response regulator transcription factor [Chitinophaga oryzae]QJB31437.1 response regulator transcription factor [Chitinophaga oryzae]QJB37920.1 response regulator transcription factor [Chitinophaga oryzae]
MYKILVIEDDEVMPKIIERILHKEAYQLDHVVNGKEAIRKLEETNYGYDLIITDIMMPYANGFEILSRVKGRKEGKPIAVIIVSNAGNEDMILEGFKLGADDFLKKPVIPGELLIRVKRLLMQYQ